MITHLYTLAGDEVAVHYLERDDDLEALRDFMRRSGNAPIALDTETTGLDIYADDFGLRLVQFGTAREAYVLRFDQFARVIRAVLGFESYRFVLHNAGFDVEVFHRFGLLEDPRAFTQRCDDTKLMAHLIDPRSQHEGGVGLGLKPLSATYIDKEAPDTQADLHRLFKDVRRPYLPGEEVPVPKSWDKLTPERRQARIDARRAEGKRCTVHDGWRWIPIDHPTYVLYAGLDVILTSRLRESLAAVLRQRQQWELYRWEHHIQVACLMLQLRGMRVDVPYLTGLDREYRERYADLEDRAAALGLESINSSARLAEVLLARGHGLAERTPTGGYKVDKKVLEPLAEAGDELVKVVLEAKRVEKRRVAYVEGMLRGRDACDRVHPEIRSLQARTARMSVANPPFQQLPSGEWQIRRGVVADGGQVIVSADYSALELRVLAAIAGVAKMQEAIAAGQDLHQFTADLMGSPRKLAKVIGLGKVYGGGAAHLSKQTGLPMEAVQEAVATYDRIYPEVRRFGWKLADDVAAQGYVTTPRGRRLPVDEGFEYRAVNYVIQSASRDVLASALLECERRGLDRYLLLPIHDELLGQAPVREANEIIHEIAEAMRTEINGVPIVADPEVYGPSWGHGYGAPEESE